MDNETHQHFKLFKPWGYISQFKVDPNKPSKKRLGELSNFPDGTMSIGRLDADSEGLLLLTTNGKISNYITASKQVEKEYHVQVDGLITPEAIDTLKNGVIIKVDGANYLTKQSKAELISKPIDFPARAKKIRDDRHGPTSWVKIVIKEGKFRQVRKMTAAVGFPTLRLVRYRIGNETIEGLDSGEVKTLQTFNL